MSEHPPRKILTLKKEAPESQEKVTPEAAEAPVAVQEASPAPKAKRSAENHADSILDRGMDETRREYYGRVRSKLRDEVAQLEVEAKRSPAKERELLAKIDELHAVEAKEKTGLKKAAVQKTAKAERKAYEDQADEHARVRRLEELKVASDEVTRANVSMERTAQQEFSDYFDDTVAKHTSSGAEEEPTRKQSESTEKSEATVPDNSVEAAPSDSTEATEGEAGHEGVLGNEEVPIDAEEEPVHEPEPEAAPEIPGSKERMMVPVPNSRNEDIQDAEFYDLPAVISPEGPTIPSSETPAEASERRAAANAEKNGLSDARNAMNKTHADYLHAMKEFQRTRGGFGIAAENFTGQQAHKELKDLRRLWVSQRNTFYKEQLASVDARLKDRTSSPEKILDGLKNYKGKGHFTPEEIKARYERSVSLRTTVLGFEEAEANARLDGLGERDKGKFEKAFDWYKRQPAWVRIGGTSAVMFGGAVLLGSGVGLGIMALGGGAAVSRIIAENKKGTGVGKAFAGLARVMSLGGIAGLLAEAGVRGVHHIEGTEDKARELLKKDRGFGDLTDAEAFEKLSKSRKGAINAKETVERHGRIARTLASLTGGFLFGQAMHHAGTGGGGAGTGAENLPPAAGGGVHTGGGVDHSIINHGKPDGAPAASGAPAESGAPAFKEESMSIHGRIFDADRLTGHFRDQLAKEYGGDLSKAPPAIRTLIEHTGVQDARGVWQDDLTKWLGLQKPDGTSAMMHEGDTIKFNSSGELELITKGGEAHTLIDAQGNMHKFDLEHFHTTPGRGAHVEHATGTGTKVSPESAPAAAAPSTAEVTTAATAPGSTTTTGDNLSSVMTDIRPETGATPPSTGAPVLTGIDDYVASRTGSGAGTTGSTGTDFIPSGRPSGAPAGGPTSMDDYVARNSAPSGVGEVLTNVHNIRVDVSEVHEYAMTPKGGSTEAMFAYGGRDGFASEAAMDYVQKHPGSTMLFVHEVKNSFGTVVGRHVSAWTSDAQGGGSYVENPLDPSGKPWAIPNPNDFTRIIK